MKTTTKIIVELTNEEINTILTALGVRKMEKERLYVFEKAKNKSGVGTEALLKDYWRIDDAEKAIFKALYG